MFLIFCTTLFVFVQMQKVPLNTHPRDPELKDDNINNCYDADGNVIVCPYISNDRPQPDDAISCLPDEPTGGLGPTNNMVRKQSGGPVKGDNDCIAKAGCKRRYFVTNEKVQSWYVAKEKCEKIGMRLVSVEQKYKWEDIVEAIKKSRYLPEIYWTSGKKEVKHGDKFYWGTGCPFTFTNWGYQSNIKQPDNHHAVEGCVEISRDLTWNDFPCDNADQWWKDYKRSYICETLVCDKQ